MHPYAGRRGRRGAVVAKALVGLTVKEGHDKLRKALNDDPMEAALKKGLADACEGFAGVGSTAGGPGRAAAAVSQAP